MALHIDGPAGRRAIVSDNVTGWDAVVIFPDGHKYRSPYFRSKASAVKWAHREMGKGIR